MKHARTSKRVGTKNRFFGKIMDLDKFSDSVPTFNFHGDQSIKTGLGAFCSALISLIVLYYALLKFIQLEERQNPNIATFPVDAKFDEETPLNLNEIDFKIAFGFSKDREELDDPRYVKTIVSLNGIDDTKGGEYEKVIPHHKCTDEEYA